MEVAQQLRESVRLIEDLKFFLVTAPANWQDNQVIRRYYLDNEEGFVSCVYWNNLYFITGTDIVRCVLYKFTHFGRRVVDRKKFEEGIFSDLRNLKTGTDAVLENPKSKFLDFLHKNSCIRTQKKQKVFYWFNVPHDKLMADALERDLKRERMGQPSTSVAECEPALSFRYVENVDNRASTLFDQLQDHLALVRTESVVDEDADYGVNAVKNEDKLTAIVPAENFNKSQEQVDRARESLQGLKNEPYFNSQGHGRKDEIENAKLDDDGNDDDDDDDDEDDDFPLDFLDSQDDSFITFDTNYHTGAYINSLDTNFDLLNSLSLFDTTVANTDEYLIEQTVPLRLATHVTFPRLAMVEDFPAYLQAPVMYPPFPPSATMSRFPGTYDPYYYIEQPQEFDYGVGPGAFVQQPVAVPQGGFHYETPSMVHEDYDSVARPRVLRQNDFNAFRRKKRPRQQLRIQADKKSALAKVAKRPRISEDPDTTSGSSLVRAELYDL